MDYRDWGRGELARRERYPTDAWADDRDPPPDTLSSLLDDDGLHPGGPYAPGGESYPTPSRRRGASFDDADRYTPAWASETEAVPAPRGGRHRGDPPEDDGWRDYRPDGGATSRSAPSGRWESTDTTTSWQRITETTDWHTALPADSPGRGESSTARRPGSRLDPDTSGDLLGLRDPLPGDSSPRVGRRRATDDVPPVPGRRRAIGTGGGRRRAADDDDDDRTAEPRRRTEPGRRRAADRRSPDEGADRRRVRAGADRDDVTGTRDRDRDRDLRGWDPRDRDPRGRDASDRRGWDPEGRNPDGRGPAPSEAIHQDRPARGAWPVDPPPTAARHGDRPTTDGRRWDRPAPADPRIEPTDPDPVRGSASVEREPRSTTYGPRRARSTDIDPPAGRPDHGAESDPDDDPGDEAGDDRRGRFIEPAGWGQSVDTTDWRLAATDDRLYRSPDGTRRDRGGEAGRRGRATGDGGRRSRSEPERLSGPTSGAGGRDRSAGDAGGWDRPSGGAAGWGRSGDSGQWDRLTDTGQWDRLTDTTEWGREQLSSLLERDDGDDRPWHDSGETFWSGTRLAGDDPRWVGTPEAAPQSPAVAYSSPPRGRLPAPVRTERVLATPVRTERVSAAPAQTARPGYAGQTGYAARSGQTATGRARPWNSRRIEDDLLDANPGSPLTAVLYAAAWYAVPVLVFFGWLLILDGSVPVGCVTDVTGGGCESARAKAMSSLLGGAPRFGLALMVSLVTAILLRWASPTWRSGSVGLAAAVVGGGLSTVLVSVVSGQALG